MKKLLFLPVLFLLSGIFAADDRIWLTGDDLEISCSFSVRGKLQDKIYPLLRAADRRTVFAVVLRKYPGRKELLLNTVRLQKNGKFFVVEFFHDFEENKVNQLKISYTPGKAELFLDGKLMKSRPSPGGFLPGLLVNTSREPVKMELGPIKGAAAPALAALEIPSSPWRIEGSGLEIKDLGKGKLRITYDGKGKKAVLWSTEKCSVSVPGEHVRASGRYTILNREYGSMHRLRINADLQRPVLTMSGDRYQDPWTQTKPAGTPERFDFSTLGRPGRSYAFNIEFYGNPQTWILEDFAIKKEKIIRKGRPARTPENRSYDKAKVLASLNKMNAVQPRLVRRAGRMELLLDGKKVSPVIYRRGPHYPHWTRYGAFRDAGIDLCYFFVMFAPPSPAHKEGVAGLWLGKDKYDFSKLDEELRVIHAINPRARVILAPVLGIYPGWEKEHPDAIFTNARGEKAFEITTGKHLYYGKEAQKQHARRLNEEFSACPSYCSGTFKNAMTEVFAALVKHLEKTPEGKIVCGMHVTGGADGQFFPPDRDVTRGEDHSPEAKKAWSSYLRKIYKNDLKALRKAWNMPAVTFEDPGIPGNRERGNDNSGSPTTQRGRDHILFTSEMMKELRLAIFRSIKKHSAGRLLTGAYYPPGTSGNFHFDDMMRSPETDFLIDIQRVTPAGSFLLHNKLYIGEVDMRVPHIMAPLGNYVFDQPSFRNILRQAVSNIIQREGGMYHLFDIGEAYYSRRETTEFFGKVRQEHDKALADFTVPPGIGVFMDYQQAPGYPYRAADHLFRLTKYTVRHVLEHSGVPFQVYSVRDLADKRLSLPPILYFPLIPELTEEEISTLRARAKAAGSVIVWGHWASRTGKRTTRFAGYELYTPVKEPLSALISATPAAGIRKGAVIGEGYTVNGFSGRFITWYEKPCRILPQKGDTVLGVYANDRKPGFLRRTVNGSTEYINGSPGAFTPEFFRTLARKTGAEVLSDNDNIVVMAENGMLSCLCERGGWITVTLPRGIRSAAALDGRKIRIANGKLFFRAENDFETVFFKLEK